MKIVYTAAARSDLPAIGEWLAAHYPALASVVERCMREVVAHIAGWPQSAPRVAGRTGVHVVHLGRFPYKIFYRLTTDTVEILDIRYSEQRPGDERFVAG